MAGSSEDHEARDSQPKNTNPFVRFRQFTDEHISSLLQGILGLPSAFSKAPNANARWADFDEDLRRRDELQARQRELRESEARKSTTEADGDRVGWMGRFSTPEKSTSFGQNTPVDGEQPDGKFTEDPPLYSPVRESLFAHLDPARNNGRGWEHGTLESLLGTFRNAGTKDHSLHPMHALQYAAFNDLRYGRNTLSKLQSDYSLLPYLLFSPYSPIKLDWDSRTTGKSPFPYCEAFEDLVRVSQGRPLGSAFQSYALKGHVHFPAQYTAFHQDWVSYLLGSGLLQQREERIVPMSIARQVSFARPATDNQNPGPTSTEPETEQDMYERFLRLISPSTPEQASGILESLFADIEREFQGFKPDDRFRRMMEEAKNVKFEDESSARSIIEKFASSLDTPAGSTKSQTGSFRNVSRSEVTEHGSESKPTSDPDKVVSSSKSSEHFTNEDGSVEHTVTVWKRFADGRETTTTTTHIEDPARDDEGNQSPRNTSEVGLAGEQQEKKESPERKGWFWN